jgi:ABC-2 type transport system permease protein
MARALEAAAGAIYDIGYRSYEGARLGRGYAFRTLYVHSLRSAFGLGRGGRALVIPWALFAFICFPATVTVMVAGLSGGMMSKLIDYHEIFGYVSWLLALFCAAQAPELVSRDQQNRVLPLYFSRALRKTDYALAKLLAMWTAVFILVFTPLLIMLVGRLGLPADFGAAFKTESKNFLPLLGTPLVGALVVGTIALGLASLVARRGIATALAFGAFFLTAPLAVLLHQMLRGDGARYVVLLNPIWTANGAILAMFHERPDRGDVLRQANLPPQAYAIAVAVFAVLFSLLLLARYRRIDA